MNNEKLKLWDAKRIILQDKQKKNKQGTKFLYINHNETTYANNSLKKYSFLIDYNSLVNKTHRVG